jgi:long-chain acyl-CoA synthetase
MLTHGNLVANIEGVTGVLALGQDDVALSFLPLCHAFERMVAYIYLATAYRLIFMSHRRSGKTCGWSDRR